MRSTNRKRAILVSGAMILLCLTVLIGTTWALFTDRQEVRTHLQAGDMDITLKRVELSKTTLDSDGYLVTKPVAGVVDFTNTTITAQQNVFALTGEEKIVPGTSYTAKMRIENHSDVAFGYWIEIVCEDEDARKALAEQVTVTVTPEGKAPVAASVKNGLIVGGPAENQLVGKLATNKDLSVAEDKNSDTFTVTVTFEDLGYTLDANGNPQSNNNSAKNQNIKFDLVVRAIQLKQKA